MVNERRRLTRASLDSPRAAGVARAHYMRLIFVSLWISSLLLISPARAQTVEPLRVSIMQGPPFVIKQDETFTGFSIQLWEVIAQEADLEYELFEVATVTEQLEAVQNGEADAAVSGISITAAREDLVDFSFPYFDSGLQILTRTTENSPLERTISALLSPDFLQFLLIVIIAIVIFAHLLWWLEWHNQSETRLYRRGIGNALWWSAVTLVGFDDKPPRTFAGRLMALVWMFAGIFIVANLTATLSAGATVRILLGAINDVSDLRMHRVATVEGTTSATFLTNNGIGYVAVASIDEAYDLLRDGQVEAVVYDAPVLHYFVSTANDSRFQVVGQLFEPEKYGIALPPDSPYREIINQAILRVQERGSYAELYTRWFGDN